MTRLLITLTLAVSAAVLSSAQQAQDDRHGQMHARGAEAMGFDQTATTHHFYLYDDGGAIQVTVNDITDTKNLAAIHSHLPHITQMFAAGNFSVPHFVHEDKVPGTDAMSRYRERIRYDFQKMASGGRVRISTTYVRAREAIHEFHRNQIIDHKTGDSLDITP
jgi:hypothetical protein